MRRFMMTGVLTSCLAAFSGCSKSDPSTADVPAAPAPTEVASPQTVVTNFLEAVRVGNDKLAESLLTQLAREKTREKDLMVAPPGSASAKFEVGAVEVVNENQLAYVESRWTDIGADGKPEVNEFVWALRLDAGQWRIGGVATQPYPNMGFLQLDFENPDEMLKQTQLAEQEYLRLQKQATAAQNGNLAAGAPAPGTIPPGAATSITAAAAAVAQPTTDAGVQASFNQTGIPAGLSSNGSVQPAGGLPAAPAQNNSLVAPQVGVGVTTPGAGGGGTQVPFQAQQPAAGSSVPR